MTAQNARRAPRRPVSPPAEDFTNGIIRLGDEPEDPRYEVLFTLRGKPCEVRVNPPASLLLNYLEMQRKRGSNLAFSWVLEEMVGEEAYKALLEDDVVSRADFQQVIDLVLGIVLGSPDALPKSPGRG
jgi:hypothetical protein